MLKFETRCPFLDYVCGSKARIPERAQAQIGQPSALHLGDVVRVFENNVAPIEEVEEVIIAARESKHLDL